MERRVCAPGWDQRGREERQVRRERGRKGKPGWLECAPVVQRDGHRICSNPVESFERSAYRWTEMKDRSVLAEGDGGCRRWKEERVSSRQKVKPGAAADASSFRAPHPRVRPVACPDRPVRGFRSTFDVQDVFVYKSLQTLTQKIHPYTQRRDTHDRRPNSYPVHYGSSTSCRIIAEHIKRLRRERKPLGYEDMLVSGPSSEKENSPAPPYSVPACAQEVVSHGFRMVACPENKDHACHARHGHACAIEPMGG